MNQIEQIKDILFSNEKRALDALTRRLEKRESRVADIADVLPESLGRSNVASDKLVQSLRAPVERCLKDSIARDPQNFADALFPVIGPAIRKSISEALKSFSETINQAIEEKTSIKSIRWRMQAKKAGIPYAQFLIQKKLKYRVDHAYLIQPGTGLLIADAHRSDAIRKDDDAVSAMLTAIQDFVSESFGGNEGILNMADIGEYTFLTESGPHAMLACAVNGVPPRGLRETFIENLEAIHLQFPEVLEQFDGQKTPKTLLIEPHLEDCLLEQAIETDDLDSPKKKGKSLFGVLFMTALLAGLAWWGWQKFQINKQSNLLVSTLEQEPGIFLTDNAVKSGVIHIKGLRDNSAKQTDLILRDLNIDAEKVEINFTPFHSLDSNIIQRRISNKLTIPSDITYSLSKEGVLDFQGQVTPEFKREAQSKLQNMLGISSISYGEIVYADSAILESVNKILSPPSTVNLAVNSGVLELTGTAPQSLHKKLDAELLSQVEGLIDINDAGLEITELRIINKIVSDFDNSKVKFIWRTGLQEGEEAKLPELANGLNAYGTELEKLGLEPEIILSGFTDRVGSLDQNRDLQNERALYVKGRLVGLGVRSDWVFVRTGSIEGEQDKIDPTLRRVEIKLNTNLDSLKK